MADAGTPGGAPSAPQGGEGAPPAPQPGKKETPAQAIARWKADLGDGEKEYDPQHLIGLAQRGKKSAQTLSLAEKRAQEALKKDQEIEARIGRLKSTDPGEVRAALRELGVDVRGIANAEGQDALQEMELEKDPVRKELHATKKALAEKEKAEKAAKAEQEKAALTKATEEHMEQLSSLFLDVMQQARLPKSSARAVFPRLASLYQAAAVTGLEVDPALAAERVRASLMEEHKAVFSNEDGSLNLDLLEEWLGEDGMLALNRRAVAKWRQKKGAAPAEQPVQQQSAPAQGQNGAPKRVDFWKNFDKQLR